MLIRRSQIGTFEMISLFFLVRIFAVLTFSAQGGTVNGPDEMLVLLGTFLSSMLLILPFYGLTKAFPGRDILDCTQLMLGLPAARIAALLFWLFCVYTAACTGGGFEFFITTAIYPQSAHWVILLPFFAACLYGAKLGLEPVARVGLWISLAVLLSYFFILLALAPQVRLSNFTPLFTMAPGEIARSVLFSMGLRVDTVLFLLLLPKIKGRVISAYIKTGILVFLVFGLLTFVTVGALENYLSTQIFPYYSAASIAEVSFFQRMDSLHMAIWVLVSFVRVTLFLLAGARCLELLLPKKGVFLPLCLTAGASLGMALLFSGSVRLLYASIGPWVTVLPVLLLTTALPLGLLWLHRRKEDASCA